MRSLVYNLIIFVKVLMHKKLQDLMPNQFLCKYYFLFPLFFLPSPPPFLHFLLVLGPCPEVLWAFYCLCFHGSLLAVLGGPYAVPGPNVQIACMICSLPSKLPLALVLDSYGEVHGIWKVEVSLGKIFHLSTIYSIFLLRL